MKTKIPEDIININKKRKLNLNLKQSEEKIIKEFQDKIDWNFFTFNERINTATKTKYQHIINRELLIQELK